MRKKKLVIVGIVTLLIFSCGVYYSSLKHDSNTLKQVQSENLVSQENQNTINNKSHELETKLQQVKAYETQNHKKTATISHTANNHCISPDFVELYNQQTAEYESILSTKHIN